MNEVVLYLISIVLAILIIAASSVGIQNHNECKTWKNDTADKKVKRDSRKMYLIIMLILAILALIGCSVGIFKHVPE